MLNIQENEKVYSFKNDYSEGTHNNILEALLKTNLEQQDGYGYDIYSKKAIDILKKVIQDEEVDIHFVSGGTQANMIVISSLLKPHESVIAAIQGHINVHEAGAIEATGHKINIVETKDGKLTPKDIKVVIESHTDEHMVRPKMVFISNSTEIGTVYTKKELEELSISCKTNGLILYMDGARLGSALCSKNNNLSLPKISKMVDVFYIGGTKNGALLGEAIVINNPMLKQDFRFFLKQKGALLAKGRILGIQFYELFKDELYFKLAKHANEMADKLGGEIGKQGYQFLTPCESNQIFPILPNSVIEKLSPKYLFYIWCKIDDNNSAIRLVTSWATKEEAVDGFINDMKGL
ncbi:MAG TPA: threonine aldolase [Clostridiales bacterium]|nr:MAG: threonine aldolase [Clostridiales bacterium GWD2_32_59]HAN09485.1 threonine aldolase [Clostridiales bacterium]